MKRNIATACLTLFLLSGAAALLSACNTTEGMGRDVSAAGHAVSNTASDVKQRMWSADLERMAAPFAGAAFVCRTMGGNISRPCCI